MADGDEVRDCVICIDPATTDNGEPMIKCNVCRNAIHVVCAAGLRNLNCPSCRSQLFFSSPSNNVSQERFRCLQGEKKYLELRQLLLDLGRKNWEFVCPPKSAKVPQNPQPANVSALDNLHQGRPSTFRPVHSDDMHFKVPKCKYLCICGKPMIFAKRGSSLLSKRVSEGADSWVCDICEQVFHPGRPRYLHSPACDYDICQACGEHVKKSQQKAHAAKQSNAVGDTPQQNVDEKIPFDSASVSSEFTSSVPFHSPPKAHVTDQMASSSSSISTVVQTLPSSSADILPHDQTTPVPLRRGSPQGDRRINTATARILQRSSSPSASSASSSVRQRSESNAHESVMMNVDPIMGSSFSKHLPDSVRQAEENRNRNAFEWEVLVGDKSGAKNEMSTTVGTNPSAEK